MMESMRTLIDRLTSSQKSPDGVAAASIRGSLPAPPVGGLRFAVGDAVIDLATGERGKVTLARRDGALNQALFYVQLPGARLVTRGADELVHDLPATPAATV